MNVELRDALTIARDRLAGDSDAYADEDIIQTLVTAVEGEHEGDMRDHLRSAARTHARAAAAAEGPVAAREHAEAAKSALEAANLAPREPQEGDLPEGERAAVLRLVDSLNARVASDRRFLDELARTFEEARTDTAGRIAARIRSHLDEADRDPQAR